MAARSRRGGEELDQQEVERYDEATPMRKVPSGAPRPLELELSRVPCSKGDVFQTKLLSPVEKRRLMKFLQLASDYAVAEHSAKLGGAAVAASGK